MKLKLDLLRHGETSLSHTLRGSIDDDLTELGWQQMQQTIANAQKKSLQNSVHNVYSPWQFVFSSPLRRCQLFAKKISTDLNLPFILDSQLQKIHFGDWEGLSTDYIYKTAPELLANFWQQPTQFYPPNGEPLHKFTKRVKNALQNIQQQMLLNEVENVLVVTHGGVIKLLKCIALKQNLDHILKMSAELGELSSFMLESETMTLELLHNPSIE